LTGSGTATGLAVQLAQTRGQLIGRQLPQLRRQHGAGQFADAALVIAGGEVQQAAPVRIQRRQGIENSGHRLQRQSFGRRGLAGPDHPQQLAFTQRHPHQRPRCERLLTGVVKRAFQAAVLGRVDGDAHRGGTCLFSHAQLRASCEAVAQQMAASA
jgi:hypothetical protein